MYYYYILSQFELHNRENGNTITVLYYHNHWSGIMAYLLHFGRKKCYKKILVIDYSVVGHGIVFKIENRQ